MKDTKEFHARFVDEAILLEGFLKKRIKSIMSYSISRYYVLYPNYLIYYKVYSVWYFYSINIEWKKAEHKRGARSY